MNNAKDKVMKANSEGQDLDKHIIATMNMAIIVLNILECKIKS
jgi:hypothetical protein